MIPVHVKPETLRMARAEGFLRISHGTAERLSSGDLPKGDPLSTARAAGLLAAKRTAELLPSCHPLPLTGAALTFQVLPDRIRAEAEIAAVARTGVEMEALTSVTVALLTLYDMLKPVDEGLLLSKIRLLEKRGGRSDRTFHPPLDGKAAVVTVSDRSFRNLRRDGTGPRILSFLKETGWRNLQYHRLPDERPRIAELLRQLCGEGFDLVLLTGGTGLSPRDVTVEALRDVIDREVPGVGEALRAHGNTRTPTALLSRAQAGCLGRTLCVALPGSPSAVEDALAVLFPGLNHAFPVLRGEDPHPVTAAGAPEEVAE